MSERAKEIALKIIATAWPGCLVTHGMIDDTTAVVEKHMLRPHQVRDRDGRTWERLSSNGRYIESVPWGGWEYDSLAYNFGPLTTIQCEPLPDAGEIAKLKERILELEKQLAAAKAEPAKPQPEPIWQQIGEKGWVYGVPVRGVVREPKATIRKFTEYVWGWYLIGNMMATPMQSSLIKAIDAAEKAMGVK